MYIYIDIYRYITILITGTAPGGRRDRSHWLAECWLRRLCVPGAAKLAAPWFFVVDLQETSGFHGISPSKAWIAWN